MSRAKNKGFKRVLLAIVYSIKGLRIAFSTETAIRQELFAFVFLIPIALFADVSVVEKILLIGSLVLILALELMNTAIEAVIDRISDEHHELSAKAKDTGSASVFLSILLAIGIWLSIFAL